MSQNGIDWDGLNILDESSEMLMLFYWDGISNTVQDVDYFLWGSDYYAIDKSDIAGESGVRVNELDLELNYVGSIGFQNDDSYGEKDNKFWAYLFQVVDVYGHDEDKYELYKIETIK